MVYNELVKNFKYIRDYMREFYVCGFKSRDEFAGKSCVCMTMSIVVWRAGSVIICSFIRLPKERLFFCQLTADL